MIKLQMNQSSEIFEIEIKKCNNCILASPVGMLQFYWNFKKSIEDKDDKYLKIGNKDVNSKDFVLINLMDFNEIINNTKCKKGTILFEYLTNEIKKLDFTDTDYIFEMIAKIGTNLVESFDKDLTFILEENITKILFDSLTFQLKSLEPLKLQEQFNFLLQNNIEINSMKTYIIFYNSDLIKLNLSSYENVYLFNIGKNEKTYNLISTDFIKEINIEKIEEEIKNYWPIQYNGNIISDLIFEYYNSKIMQKNLIASTFEEIILYNLLNKLLKINKKITYTIDLNDNIKSFLTTL